MVRFFDAAGAIGGGTVALFGLSQVASTPGATTSLESFVMALVKEGGAWALVALLVLVYRRDWMRLADQTPALIAIAEKSTESQTHTAAALEANTVVLREVMSELRVIRDERRR